MNSTLDRLLMEDDVETVLNRGLENKRSVCVRECIADPSDLPTLPCGLCDRSFHVVCVGLPAGSSVRGLYFCTECTDLLSDVPLLEQRRRDRDARLLALESVVSDCVAVRRSLRPMSGAEGKANPTQSMSGTKLLLENAALRRKLSDIAAGRPRSRRPEDIQGQQRFDAMAKIQREVHTRAYLTQPDVEWTTDAAGLVDTAPDLPNDDAEYDSENEENINDPNGPLSTDHGGAKEHSRCGGAASHRLKCRVCNLHLSNTSALKRHLLVKHSINDFARCQYCASLFFSHKALNVHLQVAHPREDATVCPYFCADCGITFETLVLKIEHELRSCLARRIRGRSHLPVMV